MGHVPPATTTIPPILQGILNEPKWRDDGFEALAFHRGKWVHVKWSKDHNAWSLGLWPGFHSGRGSSAAPLCLLSRKALRASSTTNTVWRPSCENI